MGLKHKQNIEDELPWIDPKTGKRYKISDLDMESMDVYSIDNTDDNNKNDKK